MKNARIRIAALAAAAATSFGAFTVVGLPTAEAATCPTASTTTISDNSRGASVTYAQCLLNKHGADIDVDGIFGPATKEATVNFQRDHGLAADGVIGPNTWNALTKGNKEKPSAPDQDTSKKRQDVLDRAQSWIDEGGVPYSQKSYHKGYRQDCSGYASMALEFKDNPNTEMLATDTYTSKIDMNDLQPGDLVIDADGNNHTRHVVIFVKWTDDSHTAYEAYDQSGSDNTSKQVRTYGIGDDDYDAYRPHVLD